MKLSIDEHELIILVNKGDAKNGFYWVYASEEHIYERMIQRLKPWGYKVTGDRASGWNIKAPIESYSYYTFGIKSKGATERGRKSKLIRGGGDA